MAKKVGFTLKYYCLQKKMRSVTEIPGFKNKQLEFDLF